MERLTLHVPEISDAGFAHDSVSDVLVNTCTFGTGAAGTSSVVTPTAHNLASGQKVRFTTTGTLPASINTTTHYYVKSIISSVCITIALTGNGTDLVFATGGTGTHSAWITDLGFVEQFGDTSEGPNAGLWIIIDSLGSFVVDTTEVFFPDGYVGLPYLFDQFFSGEPLVSVVSGSLPPGLTLIQPDTNEWQVTGTPTTPGDYTATIRFERAGAFSDYITHIHISADPDSGSGFAGGG